jgi:DNA adenine methylase
MGSSGCLRCSTNFAFNLLPAVPRPLANTTTPGPFLKWAGGKTQLLGEFKTLYPRPDGIKRYFEPFLGGGSVFFHVSASLEPAKAFLSDGNAELINAYKAIRSDVELVIEALGRHKQAHSKKHFYSTRKKQPSELPTSAERAARLIYLNKTCFNGLYRVNSQGLFNVPFGKYDHPTIFDPEALRRASKALRNASLRTAHFRRIQDKAQSGDFVYFDPPYHPVSQTAYFTSYTDKPFGKTEQEELAAIFRNLSDKGCKVMLSNSDTDFVHALYSGFIIKKVFARRNINMRGGGRGLISEVVVLNYEPELAEMRAG